MLPAIVIENVTKRFQDTLALDQVCFNIPQGEIFGLLGPNGAGKTTLMRILIGIFAPDEGRIHIAGESIRRLKERIGYLPEERGLYPKMLVKKVVHYCGAIKGIPEKELPRRVAEGLERVGLQGQEEKRVEELSKGNQQRVQLLITFLHRPDFLILDEPFTGLDPLGVDQMKRILLEETERGATVIISTHGMEDAEQLCKSIALINRGRLIRYGDLKTIKAEEGRDELVVQVQPGTGVPVDLTGMQVESMEKDCYHILLTNGWTAPEAIRALANRMELLSVQRREPTLHDIFVRLVSWQEVES